MDAGDLAVIAEKLRGIQTSLKILSHVPDYEDRVVLVEGLKNRLEAMASPQMVAAFNSDDAEKAAFFVEIFANMDRGEQLLKYYRKCLKARILKIWSKTVDDRQHQNVLEWTKSFFGQLEALMGEQKIWFASVFATAEFSEQIVNVLLESYYGLEPKMDVCIDAALKEKVTLFLLLLFL